MLTEKEKKTAQTAEKSTKKKAKPVLRLPSKTELFRNPEKYINQAVEAFQAQEQRINNIETALTQIATHIGESDKKLAPLVQLADQIQKSREAMAKAPQGQPQMPMGQGGGQGLEELIMKYGPMIFGGGGGGSSEFDKMLREMGMENMLLGREVIRQVFSRGAKEILETVDGKMAVWRKEKKGE